MLSPDEIRARFDARPGARSAPGVTIVAATKYVALADMAALVEAGIDGRRREPRAGSRGEARRVRRRVPLALHRPPAVEQGEGREPDLRARPLARLATRPRGGSRCPRSCRSTSPGEESKAGVDPDGDRRLPRATTSAASRRCRPPRRRRRSRGRGSRGCASSPPSTACASSRWARRRTTRSPPRRARRTFASAPILFTG